MKARNRSLYQCLNARVRIDEIYCAKGHSLGNIPTINIRQLERGDRLEYKVCQDCPDYDHMGDKIPDSERGWK